MPRWIHAAALLLVLAPLPALGFDTVDTLPFPSEGRFPAWPGEPERPWTVSAYGGAMYDSNPFRVTTGEVSDWITRLGAGGRVLQRVMGRQRLLLEGFGEYHDYADFNEIDHFAYGLRGDWIWELGNQTDGVVRYTRSKRLADFGELSSLERTMITEESALANAGYRFTPNWRILFGVEASRDKRDNDDIGWLNSTAVFGNLTYRTPLGNEIGGEVRATQGEARVEVPVGADEVTLVDDYDEVETAATLNYALGAQFRVGGRIGYLERSYDTVAARDFDGVSYRLSADWVPTQKLVFTVEAFRFPDSLADITATHVVSEGASIGVRWAATYKLVFTARYVDSDERYSGDPDALRLGIGERNDTVRTWRFGVGWEPQRHWQLGLGLDYGERESNIPLNDYDYYQAMLNVRWTY